VPLVELDARARETAPALPVLTMRCERPPKACSDQSQCRIPCWRTDQFLILGHLALAPLLTRRP